MPESVMELMYVIYSKMPAFSSYADAPYFSAKLIGYVAYSTAKYNEFVELKVIGRK